MALPDLRPFQSAIRAASMPTGRRPPDDAAPFEQFSGPSPTDRILRGELPVSAQRFTVGPDGTKRHVGDPYVVAWRPARPEPVQRPIVRFPAPASPPQPPTPGIVIGEMCKGLRRDQWTYASRIFEFTEAGTAELRRLVEAGILTSDSDYAYRCTPAGRDWVREHADFIAASYPAHRPWQPPAWVRG